MTLRQGADDKGICPLCGGSLAAGTAHIPFVRGEQVHFVKSVPADVCGDCGEAYMVGPTVDRVLKIVREFERTEAEVSVVRYRAA